jgi:hypothetical protein
MQSGRISESHLYFTFSLDFLLRRDDVMIRRYTVKKVIVFPVPSRDVTNQTLPGRELLNFSLPGRVRLVRSRLGTGKTITFFYSVCKQFTHLRDSVSSHTPTVFISLPPPPPKFRILSHMSTTLPMANRGVDKFKGKQWWGLSWGGM